jgi:hypothetical protein
MQTGRAKYVPRPLREGHCPADPAICDSMPDLEQMVEISAGQRTFLYLTPSAPPLLGFDEGMQNMVSSPMLPELIDLANLSRF